jgi:biopolymer transport protein TolR
MQAYGRRRRRLMGEINVVPYIDVMLVLLVIFMISTPLLTEGVKVDLPQVTNQPIDQKEREPLVLTVDAKGRYYYEDQKRPIAPEELRRRVAAFLRANPETPILVRGDKSAAYGDVVAAMALLQAAGASSVGLVTEPAAPGR